MSIKQKIFIRFITWKRVEISYPIWCSAMGDATFPISCYGWCSRYTRRYCSSSKRRSPACGRGTSLGGWRIHPTI